MSHRYLFYAELLGKHETDVRLSRSELHHLMRVLRKSPGDEIWVTDGRGEIVRCRVERDTPHDGVLTITERKTIERRIPEVSLALACIRRNRFEQALQQCAELGLSKLIPLRSSRALHLDLDGRHRERLKAIALSAMKQSFGAYLPVIQRSVTVEELVTMSKEFDLSLLADPEGEAIGTFPARGRVLAVVGPEGGFDSDETGLFASNGFKRACLAPTRLRSETAAVAIVSSLVASRV